MKFILFLVCGLFGFFLFSLLVRAIQWVMSDEIQIPYEAAHFRLIEKGNDKEG